MHARCTGLGAVFTKPGTRRAWRAQVFISIRTQFSCTSEQAAAILSKRAPERTAMEVARLAHYLSSNVPLFSQFTLAMVTEVRG